MEVINGYNHNIKYKDKIFHVQTEDSGVEKAHVITHLFIGGNIINTDKNSYADLLSDAAWREKVVNLMQSMHKNMMKGLIRGAFDARIAERSGGAYFLNGPAPLNMETGAQHRSSFGAQTVATPAPAKEPVVAKAPVPVVPAPVTSAPAPTKIATPIPIPVPLKAVPKQITPAVIPPVFPVASMPTMPPLAEAPVTTEETTQSYDGSFNVEGNLCDLLMEAANTISSEDLENALDSNDDSLLFGDSTANEQPGLDDMMLSFLGGL